MRFEGADVTLRRQALGTYRRDRERRRRTVVDRSRVVRSRRARSIP